MGQVGWVELDRSRDSGGSRRVSARMTEDGALEVEGQDLGPAVEGFFGGSEYEWVATVSGDDLARLRELLGAVDVLGAVVERFSGEEAHRLVGYLRDNGIEYQWWSRVGE